MSHFSKRGLENEPDDHARLLEILHGRSVVSRNGRTVAATPTLKERFGAGRRDRDKTSKPLRLVTVDAERD